MVSIHATIAAPHPAQRLEDTRHTRPVTDARTPSAPPPATASEDALARALDAERFRREAHAAVDRLADHLMQITGDGAHPVLPWHPPADAVAAFALPPDDAPPEARPTLDALLAQLLAHSHQLHHPRYVGHQVSAPLPQTAITHLARALLNNGLAVYEMGPPGLGMERAVLDALARRAGFGAETDGVFVSGGSVGNLTALLAARQARAGFDVWRRGLRAGDAPLALVCSDQTHYCVDRAARVMGLGDKGVIVAPTDDALRLRGPALTAALDDAARRGLRVFAVVASAGATATGSFDPLDELADVCAARGVWLHVDGAHGASALFSEQHRHLLAGVARADSLVWDAHKLLLVPSLATAVLYRDGRRAWEAFAQEASYLFAGDDPRARWFDLGTRTLECTKPNLALDLYALLAVHGPGLFAAHIDRATALAQALAARLDAAPDFRLAVQPATNIVCFRYEPAHRAIDDAALDALQDAVRDTLVRDGDFYLVRTRLRGRTWLRVTLMNPRTREADLDALLDAIRAEGARLAQR